MALDPLAPYHNRLQALTPFRVSGTVTDVVGLLITSRGPWLPVGAVCKVYPLHSENPALAEVVGFRGEQTLLMPLGEVRGIHLVGARHRRRSAVECSRARHRAGSGADRVQSVPWGTLQ